MNDNVFSLQTLNTVIAINYWVVAVFNVLVTVLSVPGIDIDIGCVGIQVRTDS